MPRFDAGSAPLCSNPNENGRADHVANKRQPCADNDQSDPAGCAEKIKFAKKERDHQRGLHRPNAAARFFDSDEAGANFNDVTVLKRRDSRELQKYDVQSRHRPHQILNNDLLDPDRPWNSDKKKQKWKCKVPKPGPTADEIKKRERAHDHDQRE